MGIVSNRNTTIIITKEILSFRKCLHSQKDNPKYATHACPLTATTYCQYKNIVLTTNSTLQYPTITSNYFTSMLY